MEIQQCYAALVELQGFDAIFACALVEAPSTVAGLPLVGPSRPAETVGRPQMKDQAEPGAAIHVGL